MCVMHLISVFVPHEIRMNVFALSMNMFIQYSFNIHSFFWQFFFHHSIQYLALNSCLFGNNVNTSIKTVDL